MTEAEWLTSRRPVQLLQWGAVRTSTRQQRFIALAAFRTLPQEVLRPADANWLATVERFADEPDVKLSATGVRKLSHSFLRGRARSTRPPDLEAAVYQLAVGNAMGTIVNVARVRSARRDDYDPVDEPLASIVREVVRYPLSASSLAPSWLTADVLAIARATYESCDFSAMPILADALQDAGCDNEDILNHCRGAGPHVRGCWVVDLVLGKE